MFRLLRGISGLFSYQSVLNSEKCTFRNMSIKKKPILYGDEASPPVRFALMTALSLNIDVEFHFIDLFKADNRSEFYTKINALQKVPALAVNGDVICDSHAIALYFCSISNSEDLYPKDAMLRARINELLYFNAGVLFPIDSSIFTDFFAGKWPANKKHVDRWYSALDYLELKMNQQKWLTGDKMRLCDLCCGTTISSLELLVPLLDQHQKIKEWLDNLKLIPCFNINAHGVKRLHSFIEEAAV